MTMPTRSQHGGLSTRPRVVIEVGELGNVAPAKKTFGLSEAGIGPDGQSAETLHDDLGESAISS